jgi:hypothetical protein
VTTLRVKDNPLTCIFHSLAGSGGSLSSPGTFQPARSLGFDVNGGSFVNGYPDSCIDYLTMNFYSVFLAFSWTFYFSSDQRMGRGVMDETTRYLYGDAAFQNRYKCLNETTSACIEPKTRS